MGETTGIAWTDSTINAWHGCTKVSAGCKNCYAAESTPVRVKRAGGLELWGADAARSETKSWRASLRKWNRAALKSGEARRVFGQSLSDTFEDRRDLDPLRADFFTIIEECSALTFQLLTKRPENVLRMVPPSWLKSWPAHVWIGCTVESHAMAEERIPHLLRVPAAVRFLSVEPQIEAVDLRRWLWSCPTCDDAGIVAEGLPASDVSCPACDGDRGIAWVIQGGESGSKARPFDLAWARSLRDQCAAAGVAYFLKQLGAHARGLKSDHHYPFNYGRFVGDRDRLTLADSHGGDESEWPADLRGCRAFPTT